MGTNNNEKFKEHYIYTEKKGIGEDNMSIDTKALKKEAKALNKEYWEERIVNEFRQLYAEKSALKYKLKLINKKLKKLKAHPKTYLRKKDSKNKGKTLSDLIHIEL